MKSFPLVDGAVDHADPGEACLARAMLMTLMNCLASGLQMAWPEGAPAERLRGGGGLEGFGPGHVLGLDRCQPQSQQRHAPGIDAGRLRQGAGRARLPPAQATSMVMITVRRATSGVRRRRAVDGNRRRAEAATGPTGCTGAAGMENCRPDRSALSRTRALLAGRPAM